MRRRVLWLAAAAVLVPAFAGAQALRYLNPRDVQDAQQEHAALVQELGGAETGPRAAYVDSVGHRVAAFSGVGDPAHAFHFTGNCCSLWRYALISAPFPPFTRSRHFAHSATRAR